MRYHLYNAAKAPSPARTAPWLWLAHSLVGSDWAYCRIVDNATGRTVLEWARAIPLSEYHPDALPQEREVGLRAGPELRSGSASAPAADSAAKGQP